MATRAVARGTRPPSPGRNVPMADHTRFLALCLVQVLGLLVTRAEGRTLPSPPGRAAPRPLPGIVPEESPAMRDLRISLNWSDGGEQPDQFVGDSVVAKLRGHRPWPAQIRKPEDHGYDARPHKKSVTFFGTVETCVCSNKKIAPFASAVRKFLAKPLRKKLVLMRRNCFPSRMECSHDFHRGTITAASFPTTKAFQRMLLQTITPPGPIDSSFSSSDGGSKTHLVAILAGVFAVVALIILVAVAVFYILQYERKVDTKRKGKRAAEGHRSAGTKAAKKALTIPSGRSINVTRLGEEFSYAQLQMATGGFDLSNMIMAGHTGDLYKGVLNGNVHVVVKRIDVGRFKKDVYMSELEFLGRVSHSRLVPLLGYCLEMEDEKLLVYKYMPNGDLAYALHKKDSPSRPEDVLQSLDWITRLKIAIGVAEGLVYLHHDCSPPLVHRDVKASSILLDDKFEVRLGSLSDGRVQQGEHHSTIIGRFLRLSRSSDQLDAGLPPASCSYDVFCFGKVLLELVSGKLGISGSIDPGADAWLDWALPLIDIHDREPLMKLMDPSLIVDEDLMEEVWATAIIAKSCLNPKASRRPNMRHILRALENPQKVVRDDHSGPMKSRHSSYGSWNSALFGGWRHFSSDSARFGFHGSLREEHSFELSRGQPTGAEEPRYQRRPGSREIVPVPLSGPKTGTQDSDETES